MTPIALLWQKAHQTSQPNITETVKRSAPMDEDLVLIRRVARHDRQAFEILYHRYARRLASYLARLLRQRELVEEVLNDVMLVVWQNAARFEPTARFSTWLFGIAHHKAMKALGRSANKPLPMLTVPHAEASDQDNPEGMMTHQELGHTLTRALSTLSPEQRAVVELTFYHEYSYQEIAEIVGCPVNTVKTRMFHARRRLAQCLARLGLHRA
jgi:RNA polymerase sigma-70 factor (ECF subfamily)